MRFREIVSGLGFLEGPIATSDGHVIVTDVEHGTLVKIDVESGRWDVLAELGGGPNGAAVGPGGEIFVCNNGGMAFAVGASGFKGGSPAGQPLTTVPGGIQVVGVDGTVRSLYTECDGIPLAKPNDLVFDNDGGFYFTDTGRAEGRLADLGGLYYAKADGSAITELVHVSRPHLPLTQPNGVGLSPDGRTVHVSETSHARLASWAITGPGELSDEPPRVTHGPGGHVMFDSLAVDADGNVWVATLEQGGISIYTPDGLLSSFVELPVFDPGVTNLCFGVTDPTVAYVTSSGRGAVWEISEAGNGLGLTFSL